jgi:hypothetical protein
MNKSIELSKLVQSTSKLKENAMIKQQELFCSESDNESGDKENEHRILMTVAKLSILNSRIIKMTRKRVKNQSE